MLSPRLAYRQLKMIRAATKAALSLAVPGPLCPVRPVRPLCPQQSGRTKEAAPALLTNAEAAQN